MWLQDDMGSDNDLGLNPYESFMKKHLQHYGYFTGRNQNYRNGFQQYSDWEKTFTFGEGSISCSSDSDTDSDDEKNNDNRLQDELMRTTQLIYSCESGRMVPKLREPRNLYALAKELGPQQAPRWPSEIQVLPDSVHHIYHVPPYPEPFYKPTGTEKTPMCRGEEAGGKVVFEYDPKFTFFIRSRVGGSRNGCSKCCVDLTSDSDTTLLFESRFESGNLAKAVKVQDYDYELWLHYDLYTNKHIQWFYFRVTNTRPNVTYRFTIVNFLKSDSLYNCGMRPCMYSEKEATLNKTGWVRTGANIKYYRNNLTYETSRGERSFYSLTWTMEFSHENDTVYLAHCYPYTYSDLQDYLMELQNDPVKSRICKQRVLCRTLAGNLVYILTITSAAQNPEDTTHKKAVVLTSRIHPGESNSSWMMKGFLDYLTGSSADAKLLRDTFIFKIVPMLNPDGVIVGNYRCSLAGRDLNRNYKTVLKDSYPSVWHTKNMIRKILQEREIIVYCDLHGHSRRQNVFIYGCEQRLNTTKRLHERIFPCMLHKNAPDKFSYDSCKFKVQKSKEGTGRIVMWNMGIMNSYTMEATFCGSSLGKKKGFHFSVADYEAMGYHFCDTLLDYCDPDNTKYNNILLNLENRMKLEILARFGRDTSNPTDINLSDFASDIESSDGGSDSSVSDGPPVHMQYSIARPVKKKKKLKTRKDRDKVRQNQPEEPKKPAQIEEKGGRGAGESAGSKGDKVASLPFRYSSNSGKRPRSDERANSGIPIFVQERFEEKQQKRQDYLEALTTAYLSNGIPVNKDPAVFVKMDHKKVVHFRYSERTDVEGPNLPFSLEGLCPHHGQLAAQLAGGASIGHLGHFTNSFPGTMQQCLVISLGQPLQHHHHQQQQVQQSSHQPQPNNSDVEKANETLRMIAPKWLQDVGVRLTPLSHVPPGDSAFKILRLLSRRQTESQKETPVTDGQLGANTLDEFVRSQLMPSQSISPLDRRPLSRPHLLEVSAAQQKQQDTLRDSSSARANRPHSLGEGVISISGKAAVRMRVPSATPVNYKASSGAGAVISQSIGLYDQGAGNSHSQSAGQGYAALPFYDTAHHDGRKSRKGMREGEEDDMDNGPAPRALMEVGQGPSHHPPRIKSAHTSQEMVDTMDSIRQLQHSLQNQPKASHTSSPGTYIKHLIQETNNEIDDLTNEIEDEIKHKLQEVHHLQHQQINNSSISRQQLATAASSHNLVSTGHQQGSLPSSQVLTSLSLVHGNITGNNEDIQRYDISQRSRPYSSHKGQAVQGVRPGEGASVLEERERRSSVHSNGSTKEDFVPLAHADGIGEMVSRVRSARSSRQVVETIPTKISLMICSDHKDGADSTSKQHFLPLYRSVRAPFFRNYTQSRRK